MKKLITRIKVWWYVKTYKSNTEIPVIPVSKFDQGLFEDNL